MEELFDEQEHKYIAITNANLMTAEHEKLTEKVVYRLSDKEAAHLTLIGEAEGPDIDICVWMAHGHAYDFMGRVCGYTIRRSKRKGKEVKISFFEKVVRI